MSDFFVISNDAIPNTASPAPIVSTGFNSNALSETFFLFGLVLFLYT